MDKHITLLGALYIAFSAMGILVGITVFVLVVGGGVLSGDDDALAITAIVGSAIALYLFVLSVPGLIGAWGLFKRKNWARILVLILGALNLLNIPFGTLLGIYTFWVLIKEETAQLFTSSHAVHAPPPPPPTP